MPMKAYGRPLPDSGSRRTPRLTETAESSRSARAHEAQGRDEQLAIDPHLPANADQAEGDRGDQPDARRKAVEPVDEVDAVDHADDPDDRDNGRQQAADVDRAAERALERPNLD